MERLKDHPYAMVGGDLVAYGAHLFQQKQICLLYDESLGILTQLYSPHSILE